MGMSAAQSRFLMLTAQKSNNEYEAQRITYERLALSKNTEQWTVEYNNKMSQRTLLFGSVAPNDDGKTNYSKKFTYDDIVRAVEEGGLGMRLALSDGTIVVRSTSEIPEGADPEKYFVDADLGKSDYLNKCLREGMFFLQKLVLVEDKSNPQDPKTSLEWQKTEWSKETMIQDVLDETVKAEAEKEYNSKLTNVHSSDKHLELRLKQLEVEHKAIESEMDAVAKVVQKNVESTFSSFKA